MTGCGSDDSSDDSASSGKTVKIGSIFSKTGAGAAFGPQQVNGAKLAIKEINGDEGIDGARIELTQMDDKADPAKSAGNMKTLVKDDMLAVLGPTFSNAAAEADPVANTAKTPVLAVSNTGPGIVGDCPYPCDYIFRNSLGEAEAIPANIGEYAGRSECRRPQRSSTPPKIRSEPARPTPQSRHSRRTTSRWSQTRRIRSA
ncbi:MAG: ABC transporter substrate-binding protein [Solirubrobacterales bacterium]|nr:ABC transporter substrate-binding protein [Solirubrobacterales bacterium]